MHGLQLMPKPSKSGGPPYMDSPSASYIVVVKPWSVEASIKRSARDYNKIATWVAYILWDASKRKFVPTIECVYRMRSVCSSHILF